MCTFTPSTSLPPNLHDTYVENLRKEREKAMKNYDAKIKGVCGRKVKILNASKSEINAVIDMFHNRIEKYEISEHKEKKKCQKN